MSLKTYIERFGDIPSVSFAENHGMVFIVTDNAHARAEISLYGAHVTAFQPHGERYPVLWMSGHSLFERGRPIRGGIPICWPWFGPHPEGKPAHGFARIREWSLDGIEVVDAGATVIRLSLTDDVETKALWAHSFRLELEITVGATLSLRLKTINRGYGVMTVSEALHTYFSVGDIRRLRVRGLDGCSFSDKVSGAEVLQRGDIMFTGETDRIYQGAAPESMIVDPVWGRRIVNFRENSGSAVVWNPWIDKSVRMADFGDDEYVGMVCVETANVAARAVSIAPGDTHFISMSISVLKG